MLLIPSRNPAELLQPINQPFHPIALAIHAEFTAVYVPEREGEAWYRVYYRVVLGVTAGARDVKMYQELKNELLTPDEIKEYERRLGQVQWPFHTWQIHQRSVELH